MAKKQTTPELLKEIRDQIVSINSRVINLENWKLAEDAAKKAVAEYKRDEASKPESIINKELVKAIIAALGIIGALVAITGGGQ